MSLFKLGCFNLHSSTISRWKIECDALTRDDWDALAVMAVEVLPSFSAVEGVPSGGVPFANSLSKYCSFGPLLIVDDVCTTGKSLTEYLGNRQANGCVVFCRGWCPPWVIPLFRMPERRL